MKKWALSLMAAALFSMMAMGQATPISSTPDQPQAPAAQTAQAKSPSHTGKARVKHTKAHRKGHRKHHKTA